MAYPTRYTEPRLTGVIVREMVTCGKPTCRCRSGKEHGPYSYLLWRQYEGHHQILKKAYVRDDTVEVLQQQIAEVKERERQNRFFVLQAKRLLQDLYNV